MSTKMSEADWAVAVEVFRACLPRGVAKGRDDRLFLEALHYFAVHNITWRALPGYDSRASLAAARACGAVAVIPVKANAANPPKRFARAHYRGRARIEQAVGKLKRFKRIALRCEKTKANFASFVALAIGFILVQFVHTAQALSEHNNAETQSKPSPSGVSTNYVRSG
jgi:transposase